MSTAMIAMTTRSSIKVNAYKRFKIFKAATVRPPNRATEKSHSAATDKVPLGIGARSGCANHTKLRQNRVNLRQFSAREPLIYQRKVAEHLHLQLLKTLIAGKPSKDSGAT